MDTIYLQVAVKYIKCLRINWTKEMQNLYEENYKTLLKDVSEDLSKKKVLPYHVYRLENLTHGCGQQGDDWVQVQGVGWVEESKGGKFGTTVREQQ